MLDPEEVQTVLNNWKDNTPCGSIDEYVADQLNEIFFECHKDVTLFLLKIACIRKTLKELEKVVKGKTESRF